MGYFLWAQQKHTHSSSFSPIANKQAQKELTELRVQLCEVQGLRASLHTGPSSLCWVSPHSEPAHRAALKSRGVGWGMLQGTLPTTVRRGVPPSGRERGLWGAHSCGPHEERLSSQARGVGVGAGSRRWGCYDVAVNQRTFERTGKEGSKWVGRVFWLCTVYKLMGGYLRIYLPQALFTAVLEMTTTALEFRGN